MKFSLCNVCGGKNVLSSVNLAQIYVHVSNNKLISEYITECKVQGECVGSASKVWKGVSLS